MVLTTTGRATRRVRKTPLWYARDEAAIYCISGWGPSSDWLKNLEADPQARVQIGKQRWEARGEVIHDPATLRGVVHSFEAKYGRRVLHLFYHVDLLVLVAFPLHSPDNVPSS
jgi:deazaflavin-dependent oxidoreductase (nitroreductase family)